MTKIEILAYLNRRLHLANTRKFNEFNLDDIVFIRNYNHHITGKLINQEQIVRSIQQSFNWSVQFDNMLNHIVDKFNIKVNWEQLNPPLTSGFEVYHYKVKSYE
jgi:hypothetical protein